MTKAKAVKRGLGRIHVCDNSLTFAGINKGDIAQIKLHAKPKNGQLCAALTTSGKFVIRTFHSEPNGDIRLTKGPDAKLIQVFAPGAVIIFGPVVGIEEGSGKP